MNANDQTQEQADRDFHEQHGLSRAEYLAREAGTFVSTVTAEEIGREVLRQLREFNDNPPVSATAQKRENVLSILVSSLESRKAKAAEENISPIDRRHSHRGQYVTATWRDGYQATGTLAGWGSSVIRIDVPVPASYRYGKRINSETRRVERSTATLDSVVETARPVN